MNIQISAIQLRWKLSRALGLLIAKVKLIGGVQYNVFTKLYDCVVWSIISYGASVPCISSFHNQAMRFCLGFGKYTPNLAVCGDIGWLPVFIREWKVVINYWTRLSTTKSSRELIKE